MFPVLSSLCSLSLKWVTSTRRCRKSITRLKAITAAWRFGALCSSRPAGAEGSYHAKKVMNCNPHESCCYIIRARQNVLRSEEVFSGIPLPSSNYK